MDHRTPELLSIIEASQSLDDSLLDRSGGMFYSGKEAFSQSSSIYFLGLNPGGSADLQSTSTVRNHFKSFRDREGPWSEYLDESWEGAVPGTWGMQPRVLHMMAALGINPRQTPASNLVFARTPTEAHLGAEVTELAAQCWPVHQTVIDALKVGVIVSFGQSAGAWVRKQIGANALVEEYRETNLRGWTSRTHISPAGRQVVTVTHPSRADWRNSDSDPTPLVRRAFDRWTAASM